MLLAALFARWRNRVALFLFFGVFLLPTFFWNIGFRVGATLLFGVYCPGLITALFLYPPVVYTVVRRALEEDLLSVRSYGVALVLGGFFHYALSDGQLGLVLLSMAVGSVCILPVAGWLVGRFGSRRMTTVAIVAFCLVLPLPVISANVFLLCLSLGLFGVCNSTLDVAMNAQAIAVEHRHKRAIMSSFHGLFSLGGLVGATVAGLAVSFHIRAASHVLMTTICSVPFVICVVRWLLPSAPPATETGATFVKPTGALLRLGSLAFLGLLAEGSMADWSAVYLRHDPTRNTKGDASAMRC